MPICEPVINKADTEKYLSKIMEEKSAYFSALMEKLHVKFKHLVPQAIKN